MSVGTSGPASTASLPATGAAPAWRRVLAQTLFETRAILRNGEQLLITVILPVLLLLALTRTNLLEIDDGGARRVDVVTPGVLALAVMSTAFTSQAIATAFDRRNGVLRLMATTPLGRGGLLAGKVLGVLLVEVVQVVLLGSVALVLGWEPSTAGLVPAAVAVLLGTAAFTSLALLLAGTLRAEAVLAIANLVLVLLAVVGGIVVPADQLPGPLAGLASVLPSGALGDSMRAALRDGLLPAGPLLLLAGWAVALGAAAARLFRWS